MLSFTSRRCWAVLTQRLHVRSFALAAGMRLDKDKLQRLVDEARRPCKPGLRPLQAKTLRRNVQVLVNHAHYNIAAKSSRGCQLDAGFLFDLILQQQGQCAYCRVDLELLLHGSDWQISLERKDIEQGYLRHNVALIAQEFNSTVVISKKAALQGSSQWSKQKVEQFKTRARYECWLGKPTQADWPCHMVCECLRKQGGILHRGCAWRRAGNLEVLSVWVSKAFVPLCPQLAKHATFLLPLRKMPRWIHMDEENQDSAWVHSEYDQKCT